MGRGESSPLPSFEVNNLTLAYSSEYTVLKDLNLSINGSGIVHITAPNGYGKSTLIEAASGYLHPIYGKILINGVDASSPETRKYRRICRATPALHPNLSLVDHLVLSSQLTGVSKDEAIQRAIRFGLNIWFGKRTDALSTGTRKKLWYIMCTTGKFNVAFLDEPFNGVDKESVELMSEEICRWSSRSLIFISSHVIPQSLHIDMTLDLTKY
ncbi:hypothetical protein GCM10007377_00900 [Galliscardovia ingluviei]|uniref:ABC transporter domain-containing protein n=1 Tax=Galliscardovia ingluviei TaxID=1769422 RepID=A0A8J3F0N2_9BIFI|nr:ATP-binding cassette domain-containing protein [Galliscardovia ingluviei]GGI12426.1 hypothetical protein GCM10007377_00900 [Galliscardovia ingluviei]